MHTRTRATTTAAPWIPWMYPPFVLRRARPPQARDFGTLGGLLMLLLLAPGCDNSTPKVPTAQQVRSENTALPRRAALDPGQVITLFRQRATPDELRKFEELRSSAASNGRAKLLELVLFKLRPDELMKIGITEVSEPSGKSWSVAFAIDRAEMTERLARVMSSQNIKFIRSCDLGVWAWYVPREEFFRARQVLIAEDIRKPLGAEIVEPLFSIPAGN